MAATTDFVGVRVFSDLSDTVASIDTRDSTVVGMAMPLPNADPAFASVFKMDEPVRISTDDADTVTAMGPGLARDAINQLAAEGIITDVAFVRVAASADPTTQIGKIVGSAGSKTGLFALLEAKDELKLEPGLLMAPGYTAQRLGNATNPVAMAMDTISARIIDCLGICSTPATSREDAVTWAQDFKTSLNIVAMYPQARVFLDGQDVVRDVAPNVVGAIIRNDKANGNPFKAFWNKPLVGVRGPSQRVTYRDGDTSSDGNFLAQNGVGSFIEGNLLWSPFNTATDPTLVAYRSIKRIRTRRSIEKAMLRALRQYMAQDLGPHLPVAIGQALDEACRERVSLGALIGYQISWSAAMNPGTLLRKGGLRLKLRFEETPDLTDLQIYSSPQPEAFDALQAAIAAQIAQLGNANFVATA